MTNQTLQQHIQHAAGTSSTIPSTLSSALPQPQPQSALFTKEQKDIDSMTKPQVRYLDTAAAYDLWSSVYDTDGNFLQALDSIEMQTLLPRAMSLLQAQFQAEDGKQANRDIKAVDLGCGTGRNTLLLLEVPTITSIIGLELSPKMMEIARSRCETRLEEIRSHQPQPQPQYHSVSVAQQNVNLLFESFNMLNQPPPSTTLNADLVLSTLVLEHIPLATFFTCASSLLRPGGILLLTNMHADMGQVSQAGFVDPETNQKVRPVSYVYGVADVLTVAGEAGLEVVGSVKEVGVDEELAGRLGVRGRKWVGVKVWFGGVWRKRRAA